MTHLADEDIFRIEEISVALALDHVDHAGLQVEQQSSRNVMVIVGLVEKNILPIVSLRGASRQPGTLSIGVPGGGITYLRVVAQAVKGISAAIAVVHASVQQ